MNYPPYWGYPPQTPIFIPPQSKNGMTIEDILAAENQLKMLKKAFKEEADEKKKDDDKKKGPKPPTFSLGAVFGILSIGSIPVVLIQIAMLEWVRSSVAAYLKVPVP